MSTHDLYCMHMQVVTLDMGLLVAGTKYRGEFEERLKKLMDEIKQSDDIILVGGRDMSRVAETCQELRCYFFD